MNTMKRLITFLFLTLLIYNARAQERVILLNEGMWQADNGRLSYFENGAIVSNQWFRDMNGYKLGDTPNDIIQINPDLIAIAINWSNIVQFIRPDGVAVAATEDIPNNRRLCTDGQYVYVGLDRNVPPQTLNDMLTWFGIDRLRNYTSRVFPDKSRFYYQKKAA